MAKGGKDCKKQRPKQIASSTETDKIKQDFLRARNVLWPNFQAAATLHEYHRSLEGVDLRELMLALTEQTNACTNGDLERGEAMLTAQAHTLDAIFNRLAQQAALNVGEYMDACEKYLRLALRAQSQCRATWEAISAIQNPPLAGYVRQANIAHGHQQVNNDGQPSRAREKQKSQNKLLEEKDGQRLDSGTTGSPSRADSALAAVGKVDRPKNS